MAVPIMDEANDGTIRRNPELVADSRSTAWKKRGMLKVTALLMMAPMKLLIMSPARGLCPVGSNLRISSPDLVNLKFGTEAKSHELVTLKSHLDLQKYSKSNRLLRILKWNIFLPMLSDLQMISSGMMGRATTDST